MKLILFLCIITACAFVLARLATKTRQPQNPMSLRRQQAKTSRTNLLATPADYTLVRQAEVWQTKKRRAYEHNDGAAPFAPKTSLKGPRHVDGFSRRDRHDVFVGTAHIMDNDHVEKPELGTFKHREGKAAG